MSRTAVIGLGNPLMGDDGLGLVALARLRDEWDLDEVELADGGTWGMSLLPLVEDSDRLLLIDAITAGGKPGDLVVLERDRLPVYLQRKLSPHQVDVSDVLAAAEWRGKLPAETVAIGAEPSSVEMRYDLSPEVSGSVEAVVNAVVARLELWGHHCARREQAVACTR